jgi:YHS domain-containing protein
MMKTGRDKKVAQKPAKRKGKAHEWFLNSFAILLLGGGLVLMGYMATRVGSANSNSDEAYLASLPRQADKLTPAKICMVDDVYQGDYPTLPLTIINRTYYGCSIKASQDLASNEKLRTAIDPVTKKEVDKASAIIALHPKRDGKVIYFESKETFDEYLNNLHSR